MGRTNPTYRDALRAISERWEEFRRALRNRDQPRFDQLFAYARKHADASGLLNHENPLLPVLSASISNRKPGLMTTNNGSMSWKPRSMTPTPRQIPLEASNAVHHRFSR
jgi:hypothetical protein